MQESVKHYLVIIITGCRVIIHLVLVIELKTLQVSLAQNIIRCFSDPIGNPFLKKHHWNRCLVTLILISLRKLIKNKSQTNLDCSMQVPLTFTLPYEVQQVLIAFSRSHASNRQFTLGELVKVSLGVSDRSSSMISTSWSMATIQLAFITF